MVETIKAYGLDRASFNQGKNAKYGFCILDDQQPTLTAKGAGGVCTIKSKFYDGSQTAATLTANNASGNQRMPDKENFNCMLVPTAKVVGGGQAYQPKGTDIYNLTITNDIVCSLTAGGYGSTGTSPKVMVAVSTTPTNTTVGEKVPSAEQSPQETATKLEVIRH